MASPLPGTKLSSIGARVLQSSTLPKWLCTLKRSREAALSDQAAADAHRPGGEEALPEASAAEGDEKLAKLAIFNYFLQ